MKRAITLLFVFLLAMAILPIYGYAARNEGSPFAVEIILPGNNIGNVGYYHVPGAPGDKITLKAKLTNLLDKPLEINAVPMNAYSGLEGIFYYPADKVDSNIYSLVDKKYGVAQYMTVTNQITLQPKKSKEVEIYVTVPDINKGTLLGSIRFVVFAGTQEVQIEGQQTSSSLLIDKYKAIDTAIQINLPEKDQTSIKVGEPEFNESSKNLSVTISNEAAIIEKNITGTYQIKDKQNNVISEGSIKALKMAPMTKFKYLIPWGDKPFKQGEYKLYVQIDADGRPFNFEIPLGTEQKPIPTAVNTDNPQNPQTGNNNANSQNSFRIFFFIGIAGILIIFGILIYLSYRKSKREKH